MWRSRDCRRRSRLRPRTGSRGRATCAMGTGGAGGAFGGSGGGGGGGETRGGGGPPGFRPQTGPRGRATCAMGTGGTWMSFGESDGEAAVFCVAVRGAKRRSVFRFQHTGQKGGEG